MRALPLLVLLPCLVGWNGSGPAVVDVDGLVAKETRTFRTEAVCSGHADRLEVIIVFEISELGDGVLSLRIPRDMHNRDINLPHPAVRVRYHEYGGDGRAIFAGRTPISGHLRASGNPLGAIQLDFDVRMVDGDFSRHLMGDSNLVAIDWEPAEGTNRGREVDDPMPEGYYEGGCFGTYYDSDYDDDDDLFASEDYGDSGSGCGDDDLDDDGPSGSSGGCDSSADDDGYDDYGSGSDDSGGCEGDDVDSGDSWDDDDSSSGCEGDNVDALVAGCARGGPGGPWMGRLVRWLPWMCVFLAIRLMRRRRPRLA